MPGKSDLLAKTRPLADPLVAISLFTLACIPIIFFFSWLGIGIWAAKSLTCSFLGLVMLIAPTGKPNVIYLRAFRTDRSTANLRVRLSAVLGPGFRMSGIRPPREKTSLFVRFLAPGVLALRYAGSKFMELEAGDDWMARLWKTYQSTRLVVIDIREVTQMVQQEIEMTAQTVGIARCVFVVDQGRGEDEWRGLLAEILGPEIDLAQLQLLDVSDNRRISGQMESDLKDIVNRLPQGSQGELYGGRQFVLNHVSEEVIQRSQHFSVSGLVSIMTALALAIGLGFVWAVMRPNRMFTSVLILAITAPILLLLLSAALRAGGRAWRLARMGHTQAAVFEWSRLSIVCLLFLSSSVLAVVQTKRLGQSPLDRELKMAQETSAIESLRMLGVAEIQYQTTYPAHGFACSLTALGGGSGSGAPTPEGAQLIPSDLASGQKSGYTFAISNCSKTTVNGETKYTGYEINAVPSVPGRSGDRGFCTDASEEIRYDPKGGVNCTEPLK